LHVVLRVAVVTLTLTLTLTPIMTYLLLPWVTARLDWWLMGWRWSERR
jgi:antibiotic biosynthesis monooxygenase (ABM) superfamily enzyme